MQLLTTNNNHVILTVIVNYGNEDPNPFVVFIGVLT